MSKMIFPLVAAGVALGSAGTLAAGGYVAPVVEAPVVAPAPAAVVPAADWTGFYLGAQAGRVDGTLSFAETDLDASGSSYGLHAGYLHDFGRFVGGAELAWDKLSGVELDGVDGDRDGSVLRAKLLAGYDAGRFLPYATVGYADLSLDGVNGADDAEGNGYFYGLGAKFAVTDKIMLGGEILKNEFSDFNDVDGQDIDATTFGLNVSFKF